MPLQTILGAVSDDEVVVVLGEEIVSELDKGDVMGVVGKDEAAYGYHAVSAASEFVTIVVSFVVGRRRAG